MARAFALSRIAVGGAAFAAPKAAARLFAYPSEQDNPTARTMARLFGVRDIALGALVLRYAAEPEIARTLHRVNALVDVGDASAAAIALVRREGIDRAAIVLLAVASSAAATGVYLARNTADTTAGGAA